MSVQVNTNPEDLLKRIYYKFNDTVYTKGGNAVHSAVVTAERVDDNTVELSSNYFPDGKLERLANGEI